MWPGVDKIKGGGGFVVAAPSNHISGRSYQWVNVDIEIADLPEQIAEACRPRDFGEPVEAITSLTTTAYGRAAFEAECKAVAETNPPETRADGEKGRSDRLYEAALKIGSLIAGGEIAQTSEAPKALAIAAQQSGLDHEGTSATLKSGLLAGRNRPRSAPNRSGRNLVTTVEPAGEDEGSDDPLSMKMIKRAHEVVALHKQPSW